MAALPVAFAASQKASPASLSPDKTWPILLIDDMTPTIVPADIPASRPTSLKVLATFCTVVTPILMSAFISAFVPSQRKLSFIFLETGRPFFFKKSESSANSAFVLARLALLTRRLVRRRLSSSLAMFFASSGAIKGLFLSFSCINFKGTRWSISPI